MSKKSRFWNWIAKRYSRQPIADQNAYEIKLDITRDYFTPDSHVFEVGCGTGSTAIAHAPHVKHIQAVDISERMIEIAEAKLEPAGIDNVSFEVADVDTFTSDDGQFDVVMAMNLIHLVEDRAALFEKIYDLMKPGGKFVSSTACIGDYLGYMAGPFAFGRMIGLLPLVKLFKAETLRSELSDAGLKIVHQWQPNPKSAMFLVCEKPA